MTDNTNSAMKKRILLLLLTGISMVSVAQQYPSDWDQYTTDGYLYNIQSDRNTLNLPESEFKDRLLDLARTNLAQQIRMRVQDSAKLRKESIDGRSHIAYMSETRFFTDLELQFATTKTVFDPVTAEGHAIVYIDKEKACQYYRNNTEVLLGHAENALTLARNYIDTGFKNRARAELEKILPQFESIAPTFFWLGVLGAPQNEISMLLTRCNEAEQSIKKLIAELTYGTSIYLICSADVFGSSYNALRNEVIGRLSTDGCNFTDDMTQADWIIHIEASAREYNQMTMHSQTLFFAYMDASISIEKGFSSQRIYENSISTKGAHTLGYNNAARKACKDLSSQLSDIIRKTINP